MSDGFGLILPSGGGQFDRVEPYSEYNISGSAVLAQNWTYFLLCRTERTISCGGIEIYVGGTTDGAGHVDVGAGYFDGTNFVLTSTSGATTPGSTNTMQRIALTTPFIATPFIDIVLAIVSDSLSLLLGVKAAINAGAIARIVRAKSAAAPLAASTSRSSTSTTGNAPYLALVL